MKKNGTKPLTEKVLFLGLPLPRRLLLYALVIGALFAVSVGLGAGMGLVLHATEGSDGGAEHSDHNALVRGPWGLSLPKPSLNPEGVLGMGGPLEPWAGDSLTEGGPGALDLEGQESADLKVISYTISPNDNLYTALQCHGVPRDLILFWCELAKDRVDLSKLKPGMTFNLYQKPDRPEFPRFELNLSQRERLVIDRDETGYISFLETFDTEELPTASRAFANEPTPAWVDPSTGYHYYRGVVENTFYEAAMRAGMTPAKIMALSREFGTIAFDRELQPGDQFSVVVAPGARLGEEGPLLAAMIKSGGKMHYIFRFEENGKSGYFDGKGRSSRRSRLICPLRYTRISSGYTYDRYHPILKVHRPHLGIDYAASKGTPVKAAADGVIERVGRRGDFGHTVLIRHESGYKTQYAHLSGYGRGIAVGKRVKQGTVIGYVGATGLATGPHLDYRVYLNGKPINPLRVTGIPLPPVKDKQRFESIQKEMIAELTRELPFGPPRPWPLSSDSPALASADN